MQLTRSARTALIAATLGAALLGGAVGWVMLRTTAVIVTQLGIVTPDGVVDANNSPTIAVDPTDPDHVVIVNRVDRPDYGAVANVSRDGGVTWDTTPLPLPDGLDRPFAPDAGFDGGGTLYVTYSHLVGTGNVPDGLWLTTMGDDDTFSPPVSIGGPLAFQPRLATGPVGTLHVTYLQATSVGLFKLTGPADVLMISSKDGGTTFGDPVRVNASSTDRVGAAVPVVDAGGDIVITYIDFGDDLVDFQAMAGPVHDGVFTLHAARFSGSDSSYAGDSVIAELTPSERFLVFLPDFPSVATSPDGVVAVAWTDGTATGEVARVSRSADGGATWAKPELLSAVDVPAGTDQYSPAIAFAADGRLDGLHLDRAIDPAENALTNAVVTLESSSGFTRLTITDTPFDARWGPRAQPFHDPDLGTRISAESIGDDVLVAWTDTRLGDPIIWRQDIRAARIAVEDEVPWGTVAAISILSGAVIALMALAFHRRGSRTSSA